MIALRADCARKPALLAEQCAAAEYPLHHPIGEPAADLAVCLAVVSSLSDRPIPQPKARIAGLEVIGVERVDQAVQALRNL